MIIKSIHVENFRCLKTVTVTCDELTALVGGNGAGKSAILKALDLFYSPNPKCVKEDFYDNNPNSPIEIEVTFGDLEETERELFNSYMQGETLSVVRVFTTSDNRLYGTTLQNPEFQKVRSAQNATDMRAQYQGLQKNPAYETLPKWTKKEDAEAFLKSWEDAHPGFLKRCRDDGQFFGFKEVARGYLGRSTKYLYIPAVRDAVEDSEDKRGSVITALMDLVVRSVLETRDDVKKLKDEFQQKYLEVFRADNLPELNTLGENLSKTLQQFVPESSVALQWTEFKEVQVPMPTAGVELTEDGYKTAVERTGNGLQRAFILTLLQHLAIAQANAQSASQPSTDGTQPEPLLPNLILGIEEPELYQHPSRQRHLARILLKLATGIIPGVSKRTQVFYSTHSPLFVSLDRFDQIRLVKKRTPADGPRVTSVVFRTLDEVAEKIWELEGAVGEKFTGRTLRPRLSSLLTPKMAEGFFAGLIVLVEGESDASFFDGLARSMGHHFESQDVAILACNGKTDLHKASVIFNSLGIPTYCIWDSDAHLGATAGPCEKCGLMRDKKADPALNRRLLRMLKQPEEDWPEFVADLGAAFKTDREHAIDADLGGLVFRELVENQMNLMGYQKFEYAKKNPELISAVITEARKRGLNLARFETIVEAVQKLRVARQQGAEAATVQVVD